MYLLMLIAGACVGAAAGKLVRLPMWPLTGAMLGAGAVEILVPNDDGIPDAWSFAAQVVMGSVVGASILPGGFKELRKIALPGGIAVVAILALGVAGGLVTAALGGFDPVVTTFGMVPGGVGEMVAAAIALESDSAVVAGIHIVRLVIVLSTLSLVIRIARRWHGGDACTTETEDG